MLAKSLVFNTVNSVYNMPLLVNFAERSFVLGNSYRSGKYECLEDVWSRQENISLLSI